MSESLKRSLDAPELDTSTEDAPKRRKTHPSPEHTIIFYKFVIGGKEFLTSTRTGTATNLNKLKKKAFHSHTNNNTQTYYIDRDHLHFRLILNYLRTGKIILSGLDLTSLRELREELKYFGFKKPLLTVEKQILISEAPPYLIGDGRTSFNQTINGVYTKVENCTELIYQKTMVNDGKRVVWFQYVNDDDGKRWVLSADRKGESLYAKSTNEKIKLDHIDEIQEEPFLVWCGRQYRECSKFRFYPFYGDPSKSFSQPPPKSRTKRTTEKDKKAT